MIESFTCGTAVIVCPIKLFSYKGVDYNVNVPTDGKGLTHKILNTI